MRHAREPCRDFAEAIHVISELRHIRIIGIIFTQLSDAIIQVAVHGLPRRLEVILRIVQLRSRSLDKVISPVTEVLGLLRDLVRGVTQL